MRPTPNRDRLQLAGAPDHVRLPLTLFSVVVAIAMLLELTAAVLQLLASPAAGANVTPDLLTSARGLVLFGLLFLAQSALVSSTSLSTGARNSFSGAAFGALALNTVVPWLTRVGVADVSLIGIVTMAIVALTGLAGSALILREVWLVQPPAPMPREKIWPERTPRVEGAEGRAERDPRERRDRERGRRGPRPDGAPRPVAATGPAAAAVVGGAGDGEARERDDARRRRGRGPRRRNGPRPGGRGEGEGRPSESGATPVGAVGTD